MLHEIISAKLISCFWPDFIALHKSYQANVETEQINHWKLVKLYSAFKLVFIFADSKEIKELGLRASNILNKIPKSE